MGEGQKIKINRSLEDAYSNFHDWLSGVQDFRGGNNRGWARNGKRIELKVEPDDVTGLLQSYDKTSMDKELLKNEENSSLRCNLLLVKMLWSLLKWQQRT